MNSSELKPASPTELASAQCELERELDLTANLLRSNLDSNSSRTYPVLFDMGFLDFIFSRITWIVSMLIVLAILMPATRAPASAAPPSAMGGAKKESKSSDGAPELPEKVHFLTLYSYGNHVFATFMKAHPLKFDLSEMSEAEVAVISWLPKDGSTDARNRVQAGRNFSLDETIDRARQLGQKITIFGPFRIQESLYQKSLRQQDRLESGSIHFRRDLGEGRELGTSYFGVTAISDIIADEGLLPLGSASIPGDKAARLILQRWKSLIKSPDKIYENAWTVLGVRANSPDEFRREGFPFPKRAAKSKKK